MISVEYFTELVVMAIKLLLLAVVGVVLSVPSSIILYMCMCLKQCLHRMVRKDVYGTLDKHTPLQSGQALLVYLLFLFSEDMYLLLVSICV